MLQTGDAVPSKQADEQHRGIQEVAVNVLHDQRELLFAAIVAAAESWLADRAADWITPERLVVGTPIVIASEAESGREGQNQEGW